MYLNVVWFFFLCGSSQAAQANMTVNIQQMVCVYVYVYVYLLSFFPTFFEDEIIIPMFFMINIKKHMEL